MDYRIFFFQLRSPRPDLRRLGLFWVRKAGRQRVHTIPVLFRQNTYLRNKKHTLTSQLSFFAQPPLSKDLSPCGPALRLHLCFRLVDGLVSLRLYNF